MDFLAWWNSQLAKKSLQLNPKFGLTAAPFGQILVVSAAVGLAHELRTKLTADAPREPALARKAGVEDERELGRRVDVLGDDFDAAVGNVRDHAVARQGAGAELNLCETPAQATLASTPVGCQHVVLLPLNSPCHPVIALGLQTNRWDMPRRINRNLSIDFELILAIAAPGPGTGAPAEAGCGGK